ncbi:MAG: LptF/LptG family permease [Desulfamplus sp.]|nr:LptF/LptG family permease [Desulfamplus sp.]
MPSILSRYIFKELLSPFTLSLIVLTFMFLMTKIPEITNMVVNYNAGILSIFMLIVYTLPRFMEFTIPMSVMLSVLLTMMRMSNDNEIIALKGSGISIYRLIPPVLTLSIIGTILSLWITIYGVPWGRFSFAAKGIELAKTTFNFTLKERQFNNIIDNVMIYVTSIDIKTSELKDIFIEDSRDPDIVNITVASKGLLTSYQVEPELPNNEETKLSNSEEIKLSINGDTKLSNSEETTKLPDSSSVSSEYRYTLRLSKGSINQVDMTRRSVNAVSFDTYDINFDAPSNSKNSKQQIKDFDEMYLGELITFIRSSKEQLKSNKRIKSDNSATLKELQAARMELHEKFAIPFACIALGLLSIPIGVRPSSSRRSSGFGLALSFFLFYYLLLAAAWSAGEIGYYPPVIGMWLPNFIISVASIYMFSRVSYEKPLFLLNSRFKLKSS